MSGRFYASQVSEKVRMTTAELAKVPRSENLRLLGERREVGQRQVGVVSVDQWWSADACRSGQPVAPFRNGWPPYVPSPWSGFLKNDLATSI